jgi:hypothetical protein
VAGASDVLTTFAVAVIGGVVAPQVTQARERRSARATAAERLGGVEMVRWWPATYQEYRERLILFRAAAVGANLPKPVLDEYVRLSRVARLASFSAGEAAKDRGESPWTGRIDPRLHDLLEEAVELVLMCLWRPWRSLPRYRRRLRQLERSRQTVARQLRDDPNVHWSLIYRGWQDPAKATPDDPPATAHRRAAP